MSTTPGVPEVGNAAAATPDEGASLPRNRPRRLVPVERSSVSEISTAAAFISGGKPYYHQRVRVPQNLPPLDVLQRYALAEAAAYFRISHMTLYKMIKNKELEVIQNGRRVFIPGREIARLSGGGERLPSK